MEEARRVRRCRLIAVAILDDGSSQPCEIDLLLDGDGGWSVDLEWPRAAASGLHLCSDHPAGAAIIDRLLTPGATEPRPAAG